MLAHLKTVNLPTGFDVWPFLQIYKIYFKFPRKWWHALDKHRAVHYLHPVQAVKLPSGSDVLNKISIDPEIRTLIVLSHSLRSGENVIWFWFQLCCVLYAVNLPRFDIHSHGVFLWFSNWPFESQWESLSRLLWPLTSPRGSINAAQRGLILTLSLAFSKGPPKVHSQIFQSPS